MPAVRGDNLSRIFRPEFKDHFDPKKYDVLGRKVKSGWKRKSRAKKFIPRGRSSLLRPDQAAAALALAQNVKRCNNSHARAICRAWLEIFFLMHGLNRRQQTLIMSRMKRGWRPKK